MPVVYISELSNAASVYAMQSVYACGITAVQRPCNVQSVYAYGVRAVQRSKCPYIVQSVFIRVVQRSKCMHCSLSMPAVSADIRSKCPCIVIYVCGVKVVQLNKYLCIVQSVYACGIRAVQSSKCQCIIQSTPAVYQTCPTQKVSMHCIDYTVHGHFLRATSFHCLCLRYQSCPTFMHCSLSMPAV